MGRLLGFLLTVVVVVLVGFFLIYNHLVTRRNRYRNAYAQIDVQLLRRHDLVPNLVETARAYLQHERATLEAVIAARTAAVAAGEQASARPGDAAALAALGQAEATLGGALGRLLAVVEQYPDLKADATMARLSEELASTENRLAFARQAYNDAVMHYNTAIELFPNTLVAGSMGFRPAGFFELEDSAVRALPKVSF
ncbi:MAG: LemA family protein [Immundisolibacter sp.]|jgi:LemA protein|uniref:LemA family protein n=1 Tax=Immundisolibacter sp. TaxID=1934948 RepID=UPI003D0E53A9